MTARSYYGLPCTTATPISLAETVRDRLGEAESQAHELGKMLAEVGHPSPEVVAIQKATVDLYTRIAALVPAMDAATKAYAERVHEQRIERERQQREREKRENAELFARMRGETRRWGE